MEQAVHFDTEADFREWFEQHLPEFGIRKIFIYQEVCPDYVVTMETGDPNQKSWPTIRVLLGRKGGFAPSKDHL